MATSSNPDPSDLGLRLTPFERCYNLDADTHIGLDSVPFDPVAEAERAERIAYQTPIQWHGRRFMWWRFREPLFTAIPGPERRAWWLDYFQSQRDPGAQGTDVGLPGWVSTVLATNWEGSLAQIATALGQRGVDGLLLRGVLHRYTDTEIAHVKAMMPGPISEPSVEAAHVKYEFTEGAFVSIALGLLPPDEVVDLMRTSRTREQVSLNRHRALLGLAMPDPQDRLLFVCTGFHAMDWRCLSPWVAGLESRGLDPLLNYIKHSGSEEAKALLSETGALVHGPGAAPFFFAALDSPGVTAAVEWIRAHPSAIQKATLSPRDTRRAAIFLREQEALRIPTDELKGSLRKLPINLASLPPLKIAGKTLPLKEVAGLVEAMKKDEEPQLAAALKTHMTSEELDEFALAILDGWLFSGSAAKFDWLMTGASWLGGRGFAAEIRILITRWAKVRHKVVSRGVIALERIGTGDALFQLAVLAERSPATSLPRHAHNALLRIAQNRNLSRNDLEDQAYFDIDLDIRGEREFSYGTRRFRARLVPDGRLAVQVIHGDGKPARRTTWSPPPALAADPPSSVTATKAEFKQFRKQIRDMAALHRRRFELAMIMERRWNPDFFRQFIVSQPMLRIILSGLVWGIYDGDRLLTPVRLDEDGSFVDAGDHVVDAAGHQVGVAHRLDLDTETTATWAHVLSDYDLAPPFPQLDRPVKDPMELPNSPINAESLMKTLKKQGWESGVSPGGEYHLHFWPIPAYDMTVILQHSPIPYIFPEQDVTLKKVVAVAGTLSHKDFLDDGNLPAHDLAPRHQISPRLLNEILLTIDGWGMT